MSLYIPAVQAVLLIVLAYAAGSVLAQVGKVQHKHLLQRLLQVNMVLLLALTYGLFWLSVFDAIIQRTVLAASVLVACGVAITMCRGRWRMWCVVGVLVLLPILATVVNNGMPLWAQTINWHVIVAYLPSTYIYVRSWHPKVRIGRNEQSLWSMPSVRIAGALFIIGHLWLYWKPLAWLSDVVFSLTDSIIGTALLCVVVIGCLSSAVYLLQKLDDWLVWLRDPRNQTPRRKPDKWSFQADDAPHLLGSVDDVMGQDYKHRNGKEER